MNFLMSVVVYLAIAVVLGLGILQTTRGNPWLLIGGALIYLVMLGLIGCLPKKSH